MWHDFVCLPLAFCLGVSCTGTLVSPSWISLISEWRLFSIDQLFVDVSVKKSRLMSCNSPAGTFFLWSPNFSAIEEIHRPLAFSLSLQVHYYIFFFSAASLKLESCCFFILLPHSVLLARLVCLSGFFPVSFSSDTFLWLMLFNDILYLFVPPNTAVAIKDSLKWPCRNWFLICNSHCSSHYGLDIQRQFSCCFSLLLCPVQYFLLLATLL